MGGGWGPATQSSWLILFWIPEKREAFSHLAFLDKKPKTSKNAIWFGFSHMLILVARSRNCNLMSHQKNKWSHSGNVIFSKMLLSNGARDTVQIKATGIHLSRGDKQYKQTILKEGTQHWISSDPALPESPPPPPPPPHCCSEGGSVGQAREGRRGRKGQSPDSLFSCGWATSQQNRALRLQILSDSNGVCIPTC